MEWGFLIFQENQFKTNQFMFYFGEHRVDRTSVKK